MSALVIKAAEPSLPDRAALLTAFGALKSPADVAALLGMSYARLAHYVHRVPEEERYREFQIKKRNGQTRPIDEPVRTLKIAQTALGQVLQAVYVPRQCVHGFVAAKSVATNARLHARKRFVLNVDL